MIFSKNLLNMFLEVYHLYIKSIFKATKTMKLQKYEITTTVDCFLSMENLQLANICSRNFLDRITHCYSVNQKSIVFYNTYIYGYIQLRTPKNLRILPVMRITQYASLGGASQRRVLGNTRHREEPPGDVYWVIHITVNTNKLSVGLQFT